MPQLKIITPSENQTVLGTQVTVSFIVGDLEIGREGHLHLWLDDDPENASSSAHLETHFDYILSGLNPGEHKLSLEVVKPDHQSFSPKILQKTTFQTQLLFTASPLPAIQKSEIAAFLFDKTFIGLVLGVLIITAGFLIGRMTKGHLD